MALFYTALYFSVIPFATAILAVILARRKSAIVAVIASGLAGTLMTLLMADAWFS
ncbi:MAG: hypothetical protein HKN98_16515 [Silicimonas sp.]|nr:hypothetical protein [Silicimonas sp.]NNL72243.1 hypothetical protein [Silicimonas sp.]